MNHPFTFVWLTWISVMKRNAWYKRLSVSGGIVSESNAPNIFRKKKKKMFSCGWGSNLLSHGGFQEGTFSTFNRVGSSIPTTAAAAAAAVKLRRPGPYFPFSCHQREKEVARVSCEIHSGGGWASQFERCRHAKRLWWLNDSLRHKPCNLCMRYLKTLSSKQRLKRGKKGVFQIHYKN